MCVLEKIWETIEWNHTKWNKYIIKNMMKKYFRDLRKFFEYHHNQWLRNNKNCFNETK